jgi:hypothetical protein
MATQRIPTHLIGQVLKRRLTPLPLDPGDYALNGLATVEIRAAIEKGEPVEAAEQLSLPWAALLAKILRRAKVRPENAVAWLSRALNEKEIDPTRDAHLLAIAGYLVELKAQQPKKWKEGKTEVSGLVEITGWEAG